MHACETNVALHMHQLLVHALARSCSGTLVPPQRWDGKPTRRRPQQEPGSAQGSVATSASLTALASLGQRLLLIMMRTLGSDTSPSALAAGWMHSFNQSSIHQSEQPVCAPDNERLALVALRGERDDVVRALQLREGVLQWIPPQLHAARASCAVHHACMWDRQGLERLG